MPGGAIARPLRQKSKLRELTYAWEVKPLDHTSHRFSRDFRLNMRKGSTGDWVDTPTSGPTSEPVD